MKRAVIITYGWPPKGGVGVMRAIKFAKYLPHFGWEPIVVTTDESAPGTSYGQEDIGLEPAPEVIRTGYSQSLKAFPNRIRENLLFPDVYNGWFDHAVKAILDLLDSKKCDIIFSTSPPETTHAIARRIKEKTGLPWVADMRDLWSQDIFRPRTQWARMISKSIERRTLSSADAVVTVTEGWSDILSQTALINKDKIRVITNGFDESDYKIKGSSPEKFTISYTGKLHKRYQDPEIFFKALSLAIADNSIDRKKIAVRFNVFGHDAADIHGLAERYGLNEIIENRGRITYPQMIETLISSSALLFMGWSGDAGAFWHSAKIFDYIGSGKPIIHIGKIGSSSSDLVKKLGCGTLAEDVEDVRSALVTYYNNFIKNGCISMAGQDKKAVMSFTRLEKARQLASLFDEVSECKRC